MEDLEEEILKKEAASLEENSIKIIYRKWRNFANQCNSKFSKKRHKIIAAQSVTVVYLFKLLMGRLLAETGTFRGRGTGKVTSSWTSDQMLHLYESCLSLSSLPL